MVRSKLAVTCPFCDRLALSTPALKLFNTFFALADFDDLSGINFGFAGDIDATSSCSREPRAFFVGVPSPGVGASPLRFSPLVSNVTHGSPTF